MDSKRNKIYNFLLVDDEDNLRKSISAILKSNFKDVVIFEAKNGNEALDLLAKPDANLQIDLLITDIKMPQVGGIKIIHEIRKSHKKEIPIILMTGNSEVSDTVDTNDIGANAFLKKPFNQETLFKTICDIFPDLNRS